MRFGDLKIDDEFLYPFNDDIVCKKTDYYMVFGMIKTNAITLYGHRMFIGDDVEVRLKTVEKPSPTNVSKKKIDMLWHYGYKWNKEDLVFSNKETGKTFLLSLAINMNEVQLFDHLETVKERN